MLDFSFAQFPLLFNRQFKNCFAFRSAATFHLLSAFFTLNKKQVTIIVCTIHVMVAWLIALMAYTYYIFCYPLTHPVIEHKIFTDELRFQPFCFHLPGIMNDAAIQLIHIRKSFMF